MLFGCNENVWRRPSECKRSVQSSMARLRKWVRDKEIKFVKSSKLRLRQMGPSFDHGDHAPSSNQSTCMPLIYLITLKLEALAKLQIKLCV